MEDIIKSLENRMRKLEWYFQENLNEDKTFRAEYKAAMKINKMAFKENLSMIEVKEITQIFNEINTVLHYNGSGWLDFRMQIL